MVKKVLVPDPCEGVWYGNSRAYRRLIPFGGGWQPGIAEYDVASYCLTSQSDTEGSLPSFRKKGQ